MKFRNREINVFSMSALDLFASALGAFIIIAIVLMPYFLRIEPEKLRAALARAEAAEAAEAQTRQRLRNCQAELNTCKEKLSQGFLAIVIQWGTKLHDVDLHVIDAAGKEFYYKHKTIPGRPGELSADTRKGPGVEIWEIPDAPPGEYRVFYKLYDRHGNDAAAGVKGGVYHREGHHRFRVRRLTQVGRRDLVAVVTVGTDGSVEVSER